MRFKCLSLMAALLAAACTTLSAPASTHAGGYDIDRAHLTVTVDRDSQSIAAVQTVTIRAEQNLLSLVFDPNALVLDEASVDGQTVLSRADQDGVVFHLPRLYRAGESFELRIAYHGRPARGLIFEQGALYTSYFSCDWMYCALNRMGDAFRFSVESSAAGAPNAVSYASAPGSYPAHAQGFGAGAFRESRQQAGDVELIYHTNAVSDAEIRTIFADAPRMLDFLQRRAGLAFPVQQYRQVIVRGDAAQEGAGFSILGEAALRPILTNPHEDWAIIHEMSHTYWGNLITCRDLSQFWLNEGITTFMVAAWKQERWGEADYEREIALAQRRWDAARNAGWDRPLASAEGYPDLRTRRAIQYSKGMLFMVELRRQLGEDAFWRGLADYTRANAARVVESVDLQNAMQRASRRDLQPLFDAWVYP